MKLTQRQLAARFVDAVAAATAPLPELAQALVELAQQAGYTPDDLAGLITAVETQLQTRYATAEVRLTTAHPLPAATIAALAERIAAAAGLKHHYASHQVDAALLGGFEAEVGDLVFHDSIRHRLAALEVQHG